MMYLNTTFIHKNSMIILYYNITKKFYSNDQQFYIFLKYLYISLTPDFQNDLF